MTDRELFSWDELGLGSVLDVDERIRRRGTFPSIEAEALLHADADKRYSFCLETISKHQEVWTVWDDEQIIEYGEEPTWVPIFPTEQIGALASKFDENVSFVPIPTDDFVNKIIPFLADNCIEISIFPSPEKKDVIILDWGNFLVDLTGAWEISHEMEAQSSSNFIDFAYGKVQKRIKANNRLER